MTCHDCSRRATFGKTRCAACTSRRAAAHRMRKYRLRRKIRPNYCYGCDGELGTGPRWCASCRDARLRRRDFERWVHLDRLEEQVALASVALASFYAGLAGCQGVE